jgi:hypothetical protein
LKKPSIFQEMREARTKETSPERLLELAHHEKTLILSFLVKNPSTPTEALEIIGSKNQEERVARTLAKHPNTSAETLQLLAGSSALRVQQMVAENPTTPAPMLRALYLRGIEVQRSLAKNPVLPGDLISSLASLKDNSIEAALARNPNTPPGLALQFGERFPGELLKNPALDLLLLESPEALTNMPDRLANALLYTKTPPDWLWEAVLTHKNIYTKILAAKHKKAPSWFIQRLKEDQSEKVRKATEGNG